VTDTYSPARARDERVYQAIVQHAVPYVLYLAIIGAGFGIVFGALGSLISVDAVEMPIVAVYAIAGSFIGGAIAARPVLSALLSFCLAGDARDC
jgi:hypothetical protein